MRYPKIKNSKLVRTVYTISKNHPLDKKIQMLLGKARSPRRIVNNLEVVKKWLGINGIIISK